MTIIQSLPIVIWYTSFSDVCDVMCVMFFNDDDDHQNSHNDDDVLSHSSISVSLD